jgi:hypothetical protein
MNLVRLIKMRLNETYSVTYVLSPLLLNLALEYAIKKSEENHVGLMLIMLIM